MRTQELATIRIAVKRSIKAGNTEAGFKHLLQWCEEWKESCNTALVMKCFRKWVKQKSNSNLVPYDKLKDGFCRVVTTGGIFDGNMSLKFNTCFFCFSADYRILGYLQEV